MSNSNREMISVKKDLLQPGVGVTIKQETDVNISNDQIQDHSVGVVIKQEPGTEILKPSPQPSPGRLSSFKLPRDLTLGGQNARKPPKKVYTPNLNAVRVKKDTSAVQEPLRGSSRGRGRGGRNQNERGRGRGRQNSKLIQSLGIFHEGTAEALRRGSTGSSSSFSRDEGAGAMQKPTLNLKKELRVDKTEEEEQLKILLGDSEEQTNDPDISMDTIPTVLPIGERDSVFKRKSTTAKVSFMKKEIKVEPNLDVVKSEVVDYEEESIPELGLDNLNTLAKLKEEINEHAPCNTIQDLLANKKSPFFLIQLPDTLPGQGSDITPENKPDATNGEQKDSTEKQLEGKCLLKDLDNGRIGKIILYKSGKSKLVLGETLFDLGIGTQTSFLQELISINVNSAERSGDMINLGQIESKIIASPDWDILLNNVDKV